MAITNLATNLYSIQQQINILLINQVTHISVFSFIAAFTGGIFTSISPCVVSSIPIAVIYINGTKNKIYNTYILMSGIFSSLLSVGIISIVLKPYARLILDKIPVIWPILITIIGLSLLDIISISTLAKKNHVTNASYKKPRNSFLTSYVLGLGLGVTISPCSTPITITLIALINTTQNYATGLSLLFIYIVGYTLPLLIAIVSLNTFEVINRLSQNSYIIINTLGCMTITIGSYSLCKELFELL